MTWIKTEHIIRINSKFVFLLRVPIQPTTMKDLLFKLSIEKPFYVQFISR